MKPAQIHWLAAELESVAQHVRSVQRSVAQMCRLPTARYEASPLARGMLSAARLQPIPRGRAQRLAAATELLLLANRTHNRLSTQAEADPAALVLGGDALFAQAAVLAAAVEHIAVMQSFSRMLMTLSEAILRRRLEPDSAEVETILWARVYAEGMQAAGQLCGALPDEITALRTYGAHLGLLAALRSGALAHSGVDSWQAAARALAALAPLAECEARYQLRALVVGLIEPNHPAPGNCADENIDGLLVLHENRNTAPLRQPGG